VDCGADRIILHDVRTLASALLAATACLVSVRAGAQQTAMPVLQGSIYLGTRGADPRSGTPGTLGGSLDLTGRVAPGTTLTIAFLRGPRVNQPPPLPFASRQGDRYSLELRSRAWSLTAGNTLYSAGTAVTGAGVQVQGAAVRRTAGKVVGELVAGHPMTPPAWPRAGGWGSRRSAAWSPWSPRRCGAKPRRLSPPHTSAAPGSTRSSPGAGTGWWRGRARCGRRDGATARAAASRPRRSTPTRGRGSPSPAPAG
jgi:hypothetical protein